MIALDSGHCLGTRVDFFHQNGISLNRTAYFPNQPTQALHFHEQVHISLVLQGGNVEKRTSTQVERLPGCVTFYHAQEAHQTIHKYFPAQHINLELDASFLRLHSLREESLNRGIQTNSDSALTLVKLFQEGLAQDCFSEDSVAMLVHQLTPNCRKIPTKPLWVSIVYELLEDRWNESITLRDLSKAADVHPVTISKYFPRYFNCTLGEYLRKRRVLKAMPLIKASKCSLTDIAYQCGFSDQSHLTRTFQQLTGFTPKRFQQL